MLQGKAMKRIPFDPTAEAASAAAELAVARNAAEASGTALVTITTAMPGQPGFCTAGGWCKLSDEKRSSHCDGCGDSLVNGPASTSCSFFT